MNAVKILNITGYCFFEIEELEATRQKLKDLGVRLGLRGTIYLTKEGTNFTLSGFPEAIREYQDFIRSELKWPSFEMKESSSEDFIYRRYLVKIKKEIITFREPGLDPRKDTAPRISAKELKRWYDEGKDFLILDTRNEFEVEMGTFKNARDPHIKCFTEFKKAIEELPEEYREKPVVTFCTGGVRCEKAAPYMIKKGFKNVYQLDGGILKYFEECGGEHWEGECFVFDRRCGVDGNLKATGAEYCYLCGNPLTVEEQEATGFEHGKPCFRCPEEKRVASGS